MSLITILTILCLLLQLAAATAALLKREQYCNSLLITGCLIAILLLIANWYAAHAPPFGNMRHVFCFFPLALSAALLLSRKSIPRSFTPYFALASSITLIGALCMPLQSSWRQMPALQSPWFAPHVTSYVLSYGLMLVATLIVLRSFALKGSHMELHLQVADRAVRLAFPFMTFGLWSGALWADAAWGRYWAWDIKEVWSLITWTIYIMYFHSQRQQPEYRRVLLLTAFIALIITFLVVNLLPKVESLHSYAQ